MCHLCDDKFSGLGIIEFVNRNRGLAQKYGDQTVQAIALGDDRLANMTARQASRYAIVADHLDQEYRRRYKDLKGRDPE
jgi:hypothetical protein